MTDHQLAFHRDDVREAELTESAEDLWLRQVEFTAGARVMHLKHLREKRIHDIRALRSRAREQVEANKNIVLSLAPSGQSAA